MLRIACAAALLCISTALAARADTVHVGVTLSMTGPAASLGIPESKSIALLPKEIGGAAHRLPSARRRR